jgi:hypothetical protein
LCPNCKNKGFVKTADTPYPTTTYKTDRVKRTHIVYRYKVCLQCGHKWITKEDFERDVNSEPSLFSTSSPALLLSKEKGKNANSRAGKKAYYGSR